MNIEIIILNKIARLKDKSITAVCGNSDYTIVFDFDSEWNSYNTKTARFKYGGSYTDVVFSGNTCNMPIIENVYNVEIGVFAGNLHTTTSAYLPMKKSIVCEGGVPIAPTPSVYNQIITLLNEIVDGSAGIKSITFDHADAQGGNVYKVLLLNDEIYYITAPKGAKGDTGEAGIQGPKGDQGIQGPQGQQGVKGDTGEAFTIYKTYSSVSEMEADLSNVPIGKFVMISSTVSDPDNAKLYIRNASAFGFITDLSGSQGIQGAKGDTGAQGPQGIQGPQGVQGPQGIKGDTGEAGHTPEKGVDYFTPEDIASLNLVTSTDITNIVEVNALPENPDANTLYMIVG